MSKKQRQNGGRPYAKVDEKLLEKLSKLHLTDKVIADILGVHVDTLHRRFSEKMDKWKSDSKSTIANILFDEGVNKRTPWALKSLAQKHLDYYDNVRNDNTSSDGSMKNQVVQIYIPDNGKILKNKTEEEDNGSGDT